MSNKVDREGNFILRIGKHGVGTTKESELPQFIFEGVLVKYYDEAEDTWADWEEYDMAARGYMVLVGKDGEDLLNYKQVMAAVGWDGESYHGLADMQLEGVEVLVRIQENTYKDKTNLQVSWIDHKDADPTSQVKSLDADALDALDKKFGKKKKTAATKPRNKRPETPKKTEAPKSAPPKAAPPKAAPPKVETPETDKHVCKDKEQAWDACQEMKSKKCTDEELIGAWTRATLDVGNGDEDTFGPKEWTEVYHIVTNAVGLF
jgi:hypothetical protein